MSESNGMTTRQKELQRMNDLIRYFSIMQKQYDEYDEVSERIYRLSCTSSKAALVWGIIVTVSSLFLTILTQDATWLLLLLLGSGLIALYIFLQIRKKKMLAEASNRYYELGEKLIVHYSKYVNCPIGPEYTNPSNLSVIQRTILSGRADTIKEALNILVEDAHRNRMENLASQTAHYAQQAAEYAGNTAANTAVTAVFTAANFFQLNDIRRNL